MKEMHTIEINGVKMEVDLRTARRVENIKVGTRVKVLQKQYDGYKVKHGIVIGFEPFEKLPTIIVALATIDYSGAKIEFLYFNAQTADTELVVALDDDKAAIDKAEFIEHVDSEIRKKQTEIADMEQKKRYFLEKFACYWEPVESESTSAA